MNDRQRVGLAFLLYVICMLQIARLPEVPGDEVMQVVYFIFALVGAVMLASKGN